MAAARKKRRKFSNKQGFVGCAEVAWSCSILDKQVLDAYPAFFFSLFLSLILSLSSAMLSIPRVSSVLALGALWATTCSAFYLPGVAPNDYAIDDPVAVNVNSLTQMSNQQVKSVISYDYYDERFHFCKPEGGPQTQSESLGSILFGDRIFSSPFDVRLYLSTCLY